MPTESGAGWRDLIGRSFADARFYIPASTQEIGHAEKDLGVAFPAELRQLLLETNGVSAHYSAPLMWPVAEIVEQNRHFRTSSQFAKLYMSFAELLFFGAEGNGDQFAYRIVDGRIDDTSIYEWDHETDARNWFASDLRDYVRRAAAAAGPLEPPRRRSFVDKVVSLLTRRDRVE